MATLHLFDAAKPFGQAATCAQLAAMADSQTVLFGPPTLRALATEVGLNPVAMLASPLGKPWLNPSAAQHLLKKLDPDAITAWSLDALLLARLVLPKVPAACMLLQAPSPSQLRLLVLLHRVRPFALQAPTALLESGALTEAQLRLKITEAKLPDLRLPTPTCNATLPGPANLVLLGTQADAWRGASVLINLDAMFGPLPQSPPKHHLWLHPEQANLAHAKRLVQTLGQPQRLQITTQTEKPWELLPNCRAVLALNSAHGPDATQTLLLPWLAKAGLPIVAEDTPALRALTAGGAQVRLVPAGDVPALAYALKEVLSAAV